MKHRKARSNYELIWETVQQIPRGKVATYGEIAEQSGLPGQPRLVGYALHNTPQGMDIPWYRVINSLGKISLPKGTGAYARQKRLLQREGIEFQNEQVDLKKFGWLSRLRKPSKRSR